MAKVSGRFEGQMDAILEVENGHYKRLTENPADSGLSCKSLRSPFFPPRLKGEREFTCHEHSAQFTGDSDKTILVPLQRRSYEVIQPRSGG
jgi:hypothetical protein